jgi:hypothetical protein
VKFNEKKGYLPFIKIDVKFSSNFMQGKKPSTGLWRVGVLGRET